MRLPRSLQGRLLVLVLGLVTLVWAVAAVMTWRDVRHELDELLDGHLAQAAALLVVQQAREVDDDRAQDVPSLHKYAPKVAFQVFHEGRLALRSPNAPELPMAGASGSFRAGFKTVTLEGVSWRVFAARGAERDIQVYVSERVDSRDSILWAVLRSTLWPMLVAWPLLALASWWAVFNGVAPLRKLGRILSGREPTALDHIRLEGAPSEMVPVLDELNGLFDRISRAMASERRFTADAAHELRTPIAAIRAQAQVALAESNEAQRRHALEATVQGCDRAARVMEQLLTLSRLEAGVTTVPASFDLAELVRQVVAEAAQRAIDKHQALEAVAAQACAMRGEPTLMAVLVRNLVDNSIRYSPPRSKVRISVVGGPGRALLKVEDSGPGMEALDAQRLGERFFRVLGTGETGSGLGWSIVQRIAAVHQGTVRTVPSGELGGLTVEIAFPAAA